MTYLTENLVFRQRIRIFATTKPLGNMTQPEEKTPMAAKLPAMPIHPLEMDSDKPSTFLNPFTHQPHPLCMEAARLVQQHIIDYPDIRQVADEGKMFGVLVVEYASDDKDQPRVGFLAAYSGLLGGRNDWSWFVPPVFDAQQPDGYFKTHEREISDINHEIERLEQSDDYARLKSAHEEAVKKAQEAVLSYKNKVEKAKALRDMLRLQRNMSPEDNARLVKESQFMKAELHRIKKRCEALIKEKEQPLHEMEQHIEQLKNQRHSLSDELQHWLFSQYIMLNEQGERKNLLEIFNALPPAGSGDCCAPKLLQYAFANGLKPLCLAEFWWGKPPKTEIRHHLHFYPPCRGKCLPILGWMLPNSEDITPPSLGEGIGVRLLYEDDHLAVLVKPAGMLSVPGKIDCPSVEEFMRQRWNDYVNPMIVHRLDMETSGLMVVARTKWTHQQLQEQFARHEVKKRYEALLEGPWPADRPLEGEISLPLRPDLNDRPRQLVDPVYGKEAKTRYRVAPHSLFPSLSLFPLTGRTHQLRVHCAHPDGLGLPILGDALYGKPADRLYLHAAEITFRHPKTGEILTFTDEPDWADYKR